MHLGTYYYVHLPGTYLIYVLIIWAEGPLGAHIFTETKCPTLQIFFALETNSVVLFVYRMVRKVHT